MEPDRSFAAPVEAWLEEADLTPPGGRRFWLTEEMIVHDQRGAPNPWYGTHTVATVFFGRSAAWLRVRMRPTNDWPQSRLVLDGKPLEIFRSGSRDRQFSLLDIERAAHALAHFESLDRHRFICTIQIVAWCARQRHILKDKP